MNNDEPGPWPRWFETSVPVQQHTFAVAVQGDLMAQTDYPSFPAGTMLVVEPDLPAESGDFVVVARGGEAMFRQLVADGPVRYLKPLNGRYPIATMDSSDQVIGVAREFGARLK